MKDKGLPWLAFVSATPNASTSLTITIIDNGLTKPMIFLINKCYMYEVVVKVPVRTANREPTVR